jgi:hypothetical protein
VKWRLLKHIHKDLDTLSSILASLDENTLSRPAPGCWEDVLQSFSLYGVVAHEEFQVSEKRIPRNRNSALALQRRLDQVLVSRLLSLRSRSIRAQACG